MNSEGARADLEAFSYEVRMLFGTLNLINQTSFESAKSPRESTQRNAYINSHLIHARCLIGFFLDRPTGDDVGAGQFLRETWNPSGPHVDRLQGERSDISKRLAHLTRRRRIDFIGWPATVITGDLLRLTEDFAAQLRTDRTSWAEWLAGVDDAVAYFRRDYLDQYLATLKELEP